MLINPIANTAIQAWAGAALESALDGLTLGAVLTARPLGVNPEGLLVLQVGGVSVETEQPNMQLPPEFRVRVASTGPTPQLEIVPFAPPTASTAQDAMLAKLPQQNGLTPLMGTFSTLIQSPSLAELPPALIGLLGALEENLHYPSDLADARTLMRAVQQSGLFLEANLADPNIESVFLAQGDFKASLTQIAAALDEYLQSVPQRAQDTEIPPPLLGRGVIPQPRIVLPEAFQYLMTDTLLSRLQGDVHAAIARIEVAQFEAVTTSPMAWMIELPVHAEHGFDVLQLSIRQEQSALEEEIWVLGFAIDLPALGPIQGELTLRRNGLQVHVWAERSQTVSKLERQFSPLRRRLSEHQIHLEQFTCHHGRRVRDDNPSTGFLKATA